MDRLRTFGIVAHIDAGKTTLTERILHDSGEQSFLGNVDEGTAAMDWMPQERSRGISITAAAVRVTWNAHSLQIVDTPGHVDFVAEVERCLCVLDGVVVVVDGVRGVESQTEAVWQQASARDLPRLVFVNKLDRVGASFPAALAELAERFECVPAPIVVPLRDEKGAFAGLGHAISGAVQWFDGRPSEGLLPALRGELARAHERLVELAADVDETIFADVVAGREVASDRLMAAMRRAAIALRLVPVYGGAALWNRGVDWLLDGVVDLLPSPADVERAGLWSVDGAGDPEAPFCGLVFKVQHAEVIWNYVRIVRGRLPVGAPCRRSRAAASTFVVGELWLMQADRHYAVTSAGPGEIVVVPGDFALRTGDTLCHPDHLVTLPMPKFPAPVLAVTFEPDHDKNGPRMLAVLREFAVDDPTLRIDHLHGQVTVRGMGELHLEVVAELLGSRVDFAFQRGKPRVAQRETIREAATGEAEARAVVGGVACAARCRLRVEPLPGEWNAPAVVVCEGSAVVIEGELQSRVASGMRVGPMVGMRLVVESVSEVGSAAGLLEQAASRALNAAMERAGIQVLEPVVQIEVSCPEDGCAAVLADLGARGAEVGEVASGRLGARIRGRAPLSRMIGYVTRLRSITKGRGTASLRPVGMQPVDGA